MDQPEIDMTRVFTEPGGVSLNEGERLRFARQVLLGLGPICLGVFVARAKGMTELAREQLYRSFSEKGNPTHEDHAGDDARRGH